MEDKRIGEFLITDDGIYMIDTISPAVKSVQMVMSKEAFQEAYKRFISLDMNMTAYKLF